MKNIVVKTGPVYKKSNGSFWLLVLCLNCFYACNKTEELQTAATVTSASADDLARDPKPNIIFILGDDIGYEIPAVNGGQSYTTPNIDFLAANGVRFTQCYGAANCSPSRFMLLTGKYSFRNYTKWGVMDPSEKTLGNMFKNAGYATCYAGKWQLDGGDNSARAFGFDKYSMWLPFYKLPEESPRYKSPEILQDGAYLPASETKDKYSVDIFTKYIQDFIDSNQRKPFFIYYSMPLCHKVFCPTPDDPEYATYDFTKSDPKFFPGMVNYMDKQIGLLLAKINSAGLRRKTIFVFLGDNGSPKNIVSTFNGYEVPGEKGQTTAYGTHVPLIFYWPKNAPEGVVTNQLVDFTDFMPTLANLTGIPVPANYGILDGKDFSQVVKGTATSSSRDAVFLHFQPFLNESGNRLFRYAANSTYKLYDETGFFYNVVNDIEEQHPIPAGSLTPQELLTKQYFEQIISTMHK